MVFQAQVYAIKAGTVENLDTNYKYRNIYILSESQAAIKALDNHQITSSWIGTALNPSHNFPNIIGFN
jgi:hypothetical protein